MLGTSLTFCSESSTTSSADERSRLACASAIPSPSIRTRSPNETSGDSGAAISAGTIGSRNARAVGLGSGATALRGRRGPVVHHAQLGEDPRRRRDGHHLREEPGGAV